MKTTEEAKLMIKFWLIAAAALVFGWVTVALAQDGADPYTRRDWAEVQEHAASNTDNRLLYPGSVNFYAGKQERDDANRHLYRYSKQHNVGSGANSKGLVYNPYTIRW